MELKRSGFDGRADRLKFAIRDWIEFHFVSGPQQRGADSLRIEQANGRRANQMPAARAFKRVNDAQPT
jgi:hypothetical protein